MTSFFRTNNLPSAEILLEKRDSKPFYLAGETLSGKLVLDTDELISIKDLCLSFIVNTRRDDHARPVMVPLPPPDTKNKILYQKEIHLSLPSSENISSVSNPIFKSCVRRSTLEENVDLFKISLLL